MVACIRQGADERQHFTVCRSCLLIDRLSRIRRVAQGFGFGPIAVELAVRHCGVDMQLRFDAVRMHHVEQIQILLGLGLSRARMPIDRVRKRRVGRGHARCTIHVLQPVQELTLCLNLRHFIQTRLCGLARGLPLRRGWREKRRIAQQCAALVGGLDGKGYTVFALGADRATAVAVPGKHLACGRQAQLNLGLVRMGAATLHFSDQQPMLADPFNVEAEYALLVEKNRPAALPCGGVGKPEQRFRAEPQVIGWGHLLYSGVRVWKGGRASHCVFYRDMALTRSR